MNTIAFAPFGYAAGVSLGVIIFGDSVGARPENPGVTFVAPLGTSFGVTALSLLGLLRISTEAYIIGTAVLAPLLTAVVYNSVKRPRVEGTVTGSRVTVSPYATLLTESDGGVIPTYGVTVGL